MLKGNVDLCIHWERMWEGEQMPTEAGVGNFFGKLMSKLMLK